MIEYADKDLALQEQIPANTEYKLLPLDMSVQFSLLRVSGTRSA